LTFIHDQAHPERNLLAYPVGRQLGIRDLKSNTMKFFKSPDQDFIEITALGYSKSKKHVAVGFIKQGDKRAYVGVHQTKNGDQKLKHLLTIDLFDGLEVPTVQKHVSSVAVSSDGSHILVVMSGGGETRVTAYKLSKNTGPWISKVVCSQDFHPGQQISKCSFHPTDKTMILLMGPGFLQ